MLQETQAKLSAVEASLEAMQGHRDELQQQLDQAVELYNVVQGETCCNVMGCVCVLRSGL